MKVGDVPGAAEEALLKALKNRQELAVESVARMRVLAQAVMPDKVNEVAETASERVPDITPIVDGVFDFAAKILEMNRDFVEEVVKVMQSDPRRGPVEPTSAAAAAAATEPAAPAKKPVAKKVAAKKPVAKKVAAKKPAAKKVAAKKPAAKKVAAKKPAVKKSTAKKAAAKKTS